MNHPLFEYLNHISERKKTGLYIVGGFIRDLLIGRNSYDLDLVTEDDPQAVGMNLADMTGGDYYSLNLEHATARVNLYWGNTFWQVDIGMIRGDDIIEDLSKRDFTVNAIALPVSDCQKENWPEFLLDPLEGKKDLEKKLIRTSSEEAILEDPLRIIRGIRLSAQLQFQLEERTLHSFRDHKNRLNGVAGERLKMEWGKLLERPSADYFKIMKDLSILETLFPGLEDAFLESQHYNSKGWEHSLATLHHLEYLLHKQPFPVAWKRLLVKYLNEKLRGGWTREQVLKLAALMPNTFIKVPSADFDALGDTYYEEADRKAGQFSRYTGRLRLSKQERNMLHHLAFFYLHPLFLYRTPERTGRTIYRFFRQLGSDAPGVILLSLAGHNASLETLELSSSLPSASEYRRFIYNLLYRYLVKERRYVSPPSLVTGREVMSLLNIEESTLVGRILEIIAEAQAEGLISTRQEAFQLAEDEYRRLSAKEK